MSDLSLSSNGGAGVSDGKVEYKYLNLGFLFLRLFLMKCMGTILIDGLVSARRDMYNRQQINNSSRTLLNKFVNGLPANYNRTGTGTSISRQTLSSNLQLQNVSRIHERAAPSFLHLVDFHRSAFELARYTWDRIVTYLLWTSLQSVSKYQAGIFKP